MPKTLNEYGYCWGNPVNYVDLDGAWPEWMEDVDGWIKSIEEKNKDKTGTFSKGVNLSATASIWQFDGSIGISMDWKGNIAIQATGTGGPTAGTPSIGILEYHSLTDAPSVFEINGDGAQIGGAGFAQVSVIPAGVMGGVDFNLLGNANDTEQKYYGITVSKGIGVGTTGGELHAEWGKTETIFSMNIFELWDKLYRKADLNAECKD